LHKATSLCPKGHRPEGGKKKTATFVPLAFARLRAKVIFIRIKTRSRSTFALALQPFSYFYKNKNS
jgi:hypothetical protein